MSCDESDPKPAVAEVAKEPTIRVELPPPPNFDEGRAPKTWEDDAYSIYGLRSHLDERVKEGDAGKVISVKGFVQEVYVPPDCPKGEVCPPPKQPHFWIADSPDEKGKKRAMMVVNYSFTIPDWDARRWRGQPDVALEQGKRYTLKGRFKQFTDTGFAYDRGLLEFHAYKMHDPKTGEELETWVYPPGASWHPLEVARMESENAKLAEKSKRSLRR